MIFYMTFLYNKNYSEKEKLVYEKSRIFDKIIGEITETPANGIFRKTSILLKISLGLFIDELGHF